ncbi:hypothetical protein GCM10022245_73360 [Streptomyces mayteni]
MENAAGSSGTGRAVGMGSSLASGDGAVIVNPLLEPSQALICSVEPGSGPIRNVHKGGHIHTKGVHVVRGQRAP